MVIQIKEFLKYNEAFYLEYLYAFNKNVIILFVINTFKNLTMNHINFYLSIRKNA
jgi:hypothetical protein